MITLTRLTEQTLASSLDATDIFDISKKISTSPDVWESQQVTFSVLNESITPKILSFKTTIAAADFKNVGDAIKLLDSPGDANQTITIIAGTPVIRKGAGASYSFSGATYIALGGGPGDVDLATIPVSVISGNAPVFMLPQTVAGGGYGSNNEIYIYTDNGSNSLVGAGSVTISFLYYVNDTN